MKTNLIKKSENKNSKFYFLFSIFSIFILFSIFYFLFSDSVNAQVIGNFDFLKGIVPCGTSYAPQPCTVCDFYKLIQNVINFLLYTSASLATLMAIYIGMLFLFSGGSPKKIEDAKGKLWLLVWGIAWVLGSWLVLNTIITTFADPGVFHSPWYQVSCDIGQSSSGSNASPGASSGPFPGSGGGSTVSNALPFDPGGLNDIQPAALQRLDSGTYQDGIDTGSAAYQQMDDQHYGLKQVDPSPAYTAIDPISPTVDQQVSKVNTGNVVNPNLVKAIIQAESSGNPNAVSLDQDGKHSYGLMQVRPETAKNYDSSLKGLTDAQIGQKLKDPNYNIPIGTAYLQDLAAKYNGDLNKVIAAYNGGPGANSPSVDCPGSTRWQCGWDNQAHTVPNTGYQITRNYVTRVKQYYSQINQ